MLEGDKIQGSVGRRAKTSGSQRAPNGDGGRQRSGEAPQGWAETDDSPQLLPLAGDLHCPKASLSASATFLLRSAGCLTLAHPGAGGGCLDASLPRSFPDTRRLTRAAHRGTALPELCAGSALCQGWLGAILPRHTDQPVLAGTPPTLACRTPFVSLLRQLLQAGIPQPHQLPSSSPPADFLTRWPSPFLTSLVLPGLPQPTAGAHLEEGLSPQLTAHHSLTWTLLQSLLWKKEREKFEKLGK